jgi:hypothetical protein
MRDQALDFVQRGARAHGLGDGYRSIQPDDRIIAQTQKRITINCVPEDNLGPSKGASTSTRPTASGALPGADERELDATGSSALARRSPAYARPLAP